MELPHIFSKCFLPRFVTNYGNLLSVFVCFQLTRRSSAVTAAWAPTSSPWSRSGASCGPRTCPTRGCSATCFGPTPTRIPPAGARMTAEWASPSALRWLHQTIYTLLSANLVSIPSHQTLQLQFWIVMGPTSKALSYDHIGLGDLLLETREGTLHKQFSHISSPPVPFPKTVIFCQNYFIFEAGYKGLLTECKTHH